MAHPARRNAGHLIGYRQGLVTDTLDERGGRVVYSREDPGRSGQADGPNIPHLTAGEVGRAVGGGRMRRGGWSWCAGARSARCHEKVAPGTCLSGWLAGTWVRQVPKIPRFGPKANASSSESSACCGAAVGKWSDVGGGRPNHCRGHRRGHRRSSGRVRRSAEATRGVSGMHARTNDTPHTLPPHSLPTSTTWDCGENMVSQNFSHRHATRTQGYPS